MIIKKIMYMIIGSLLFFTSCSVGVLSSRVYDDTKATKKADKNLELIVSSIKEKDKEQLRKLFSKKALSKSENFDTQFETLLEFLEGEFASWEVSSARQISSNMSYGDKTIKIGTYGKLTTNSNEYRIYVVDFC